MQSFGRRECGEVFVRIVADNKNQQRARTITFMVM
jgi:hypothetical protein